MVHLKMLYDPISGNAVRDGSVKAYLSNIIEVCKIDDEYIEALSTENIFTEARLTLARGEVDQVTFYFGDQTIPK